MVPERGLGPNYCISIQITLSEKLGKIFETESTLSDSIARVLKMFFKNVRNGLDQVTFLDFMFSLLIWELSKLETEQALKYLTVYLINNNC